MTTGSAGPTIPAPVAERATGEADAQAPTRWWRRRPDLVLVALLAAAFVRYLLPGLDGRLDPDAAVYAYGAQQAAEGVPPYVSILNRAGPLGHLVPGGAVVVGRWWGVDDLVAMRLLYLLLAVATVGLVYLLGSWVLRSRWAGLVAGSVLLSFHGFAAYAAFGPREKTLMVFFFAVTLCAAARGRWVLTGVGVAAATLTWQPAFFAAFPAVLATALLRRRGPGEPGRRAATLRVLLGGLVPTLAAVVLYAVPGQLRVALDAFVLIHLRYTEQGGFFENASRSLTNVRVAERWPGLLLVLGLPLLLVLAGHALLGARAGGRAWVLDPPEATLVGLGVATLGGLTWCLRAFQGWPDLFVLLPLAAIGSAGLVPLARRLAGARAGVAVACALVLLTGCASASHALSLRDDQGLRAQRELASRVNEAIGPEASVLAFGASDALVLLGKRNPTRHQRAGAGLRQYYRATMPGGLRGYARRITRIQPDVIVLRRRRISPWLRPLRADYDQVGRTGAWLWLASSDLAPGRREALTAVLADYGKEITGWSFLVRPNG